MRHSFAAPSPPDSRLSPSFKVTRGYKYAMHIVLRGSAIIKAAGYPDYSLGVGEAVVHPVKYLVRITPPHGLRFRDVLTIII